MARTRTPDSIEEPVSSPAPIRAPRVPQEWADEPMFLYVIETGDFVKVGLSRNVDQRMREMDLLNPLTPRLVLFRTLTRNTAPAVEKHAHGLLAEFHHKREWFRTPPMETLRQAIKKAVEEGKRVDRADWVLERKRLANLDKLRARYKPGIVFVE